MSTISNKEIHELAAALKKHVSKDLEGEALQLAHTCIDCTAAVVVAFLLNSESQARMAKALEEQTGLLNKAYSQG